MLLHRSKLTLDKPGETPAKANGGEDATATNHAINTGYEPSGGKLPAGRSQLSNIANKTGTEFAKVQKKQIAGNGISNQAVLEAATVGSPAGAEGKLPWK